MFLKMAQIKMLAECWKWLFEFAYGSSNNPDRNRMTQPTQIPAEKNFWDPPWLDPIDGYSDSEYLSTLPGKMLVLRQNRQPC